MQMNQKTREYIKLALTNVGAVLIGYIMVYIMLL